MNKNQRENLQKAFISFHEQHVELTNVITAEDRPVIQVICRQCEWSE
jgi:hypothetical protein